MLPVFSAELAVRCREENQVGDRESQREYLHGAESVVQQHLRAYETRAPEGNRRDGENMPEGEGVAGGNHGGKDSFF